MDVKIKYHLVICSIFLLFSCNQSNELESSDKDLLANGSWVIYDMENNDSEDSVGIVLGVWLLGEVDFESIEFKPDGYYEVYNNQGKSVFSEEYRYENNKLIFDKNDDIQTLQVKKLDSNYLFVESQDGVITKLRKK